MDRETSTSHDVLERTLLDESAEPTSLPLSLLQYITNHFSLDNQIGSGGFAVVYKGMVGKGMVAVKKLSNTFGLHENKFHEEVKCLINAKHKNIVRFLGYCAETQGKMQKFEGKLVMADQRNWLLCFEYVCNGSLDKHITDATCGLNWRERYRIIKGITEGLLFLHEIRILHLDLKPANILLDGHLVPKIADFGLSRCLGEDQTRAITENLSGTLGYMDPEYLRSRQIAFASDIYSLGVIIMEILTGAKRYLDDDYLDESIGCIREAHAIGTRVCSKIGIECMNLDPKKRPVARHIIDRLDKTTSADYSEETCVGSSSFESQISLPREQFGERIGKLGAESLQKADVKEHSILEDVAERLEWLHMQECQLKVGQLPLWGVQDMKEKVNHHRANNSSSICTGFSEKNILDIFNTKTRSNTLVVVKTLVSGNMLEINMLENEVIVQSQIVHKNIAWLIGCCLEMENLMLVYEFLSRGSLHDILHSGSKVPLNLDMRLNIIEESAHGLAYLHSQAHTKIVHSNIKPASILLDENFVPKISDLGLSRLIMRDNEHAESVIGDMNYMDPVYMQTGLLTEKSDVYSFGIVILEIISRKKASHSDNNSLVKCFLEVHEKGKKATELFDKEIALTGNLELLDYLAEIAVECLNLDVDQRPSMTDVAERLVILNRSRRLHAQHISGDYADETDISNSFAEQNKEGQFWGVQDTDHPGVNISSSISTGLNKLNSLDIFNRKARMNSDTKSRRILEKSHFIKIFKKKQVMSMLKTNNLIEVDGFYEVYKGIVDTTVVAVKKLINGNMIENEHFENVVIIQSQVIHKNIHRLIGCCLEMDISMLVYEFLSKGSLDDILHSSSKVPLSLDMLLAIVAESAQGLAYLHSQAHCKILHGDVKPGNILLDENFMPKISDFGLSKLIASDNEHARCIIGDMSYMDPIYLQTGLLTEKSDVYSFGIVILEVISRKKASHSDDNSLVKSFLKVHEEGKKATDLFDKKIAVKGNLEILDYLAEIAVQCLNLNVDQRPTMTYVAERLLTLQRYRRSQVVGE
ncbi:hypothetical protein ACQ4PT_002545 [Festuca glaucescens]